jgi:hypothetical protein
MAAESADTMERVKADPRPVTPGGTAPRLAFAMDIIGYGHRDVGEKEALRVRVDALVGRVLADLGIPRMDAEAEASGDSTVVFLPSRVPAAHALPRMISAVAERLIRDNQRYQDRMRLRMAVSVGPHGFTEVLYRLVDSRVLRQAISDNEHANLALLVTPDLLHSAALDRADFSEVEIKTKESVVTAWLRVC